MAAGTARVMGDLISGRRDEVFLVSKVYPHNASAQGTVAACERSLKRLGTDRIDLYLLHWRGAHPLAETVAAFERLQRTGKIRHWGVSNLDAEDMAELAGVPDGEACATNQVLYNPGRRGPEWDLLPWCRERGIPVMAYSPLEQGRLSGSAVLRSLARERGCGPLQIALAWVLAQPEVLALPKASRVGHVEANAAALGIELSAQELAAIDREFPPPAGPVPLAML
jgi:diketogulonate reductase-like aldo/keto reductase